MNTPVEEIDLVREKEELEIFLSRYTGAGQAPEAQKKAPAAAAAEEQPAAGRRSEGEEDESPVPDYVTEAFGEDKDKDKPKPSAGRHPRSSAGLFARNGLKAAGVLIFALAVFAQGYLWMDPEAGHRSFDWLAANTSLLDPFLPEGSAQRDDVAGQVRLTDLRQHLIHNPALGTIRTIEGNAVNTGSSPLSKIRVMGVLYNVRGETVSARVSACGNIVSQEQLGSMGEEDIRAALSNPSVGAATGIPPEGRVPFMIVFIREPEGVESAAVMPVSAEKTSP